jgi:hypothetical protein
VLRRLTPGVEVADAPARHQVDVDGIKDQRKSFAGEFLTIPVQHPDRYPGFKETPTLEAAPGSIRAGKT